MSDITEEKPEILENLEKEPKEASELSLVAKLEEEGDIAADYLEALLDKPDEDWAGWVETLRDRRELRNDDTTVVVVLVG